MPERWTRPLVESVILPAHAATSPDEPPEKKPEPCEDTFVIAGVTLPCEEPEGVTNLLFTFSLDDEQC